MLQNRKKALFVSMTALFLLTAFSVEAKNGKPTVSVKTQTATSISLGITQKKLKNKKTHVRVLQKGGDDNYTKLLLHNNGANGSNTLNNECKTPLAGRTIANNNVVISTDQFKFGTASALFNGVSSYLALNDHADWNFGGGIWTVDAWVRVNSLAGERTVFSQKTDALNNIRGFVKTDGSLSLTIENNGATTSLTSATGKITANNWHHIAFVENGNDYFLFVDGSKLTSLVSSVRPADYTGLLSIGYTDILDETAPFSGYMDEFRLSNGVARWTDSFTLATKAFGYEETLNTISKTLNSSGKGTVTLSNLLPNMEYSFSTKIKKRTENSKKYSSYSGARTGRTSN